MIELIIVCISSESERCIALLQESVRTLLQCLETVDADLLVRKGYFTLGVQEGIKCASFLRRIYEEVGYLVYYLNNRQNGYFNCRYVV